MEKTPEKPKKVTKARNTKIYPVAVVLEKYNLTPQEFQDIAQEINNFQKYIVGTEGITVVGLMQVGKAVKKLKGAVKKKHVEAQEVIKQEEADAPIIRELLTCGQPPNKLKLWCKCPHTDSKVVVNVSRKVHDGYKLNQTLLCEKIADGLFVHPPVERG